MQKKLMVLFAFVIFVLVLGWAITPAQAHCNGDPDHEVKHKNCPGGGDGGGATVPLCVAIRDDPDNFDDKVTPDGDRMPYCHGEEAETDISSSFYVISRIANGTGNTTVAAANFSDTPVRSIGLNFSDCIEECDRDFANKSPFSVVSHASFTFATRGFDIRSIPTDGTEQFVDLFLRFSLKDDEKKTTRQINFRDADDCVGKPVTVTRISNGCWQVEGDEGCLFIKPERGHNASITKQGTYHMPFSMTLQAFSGTFNEGEPFDVATCDPS